jgi:alanine racemase
VSAPRVWAEVRLPNLEHNLELIRRRLESRVRIMVVVKADAYGHGAIPVAWTCLRAGAHMLGVGNSSEAIELREAGITAPVLVLGAIIEGEVSAVVEYGISSCIHSENRLDLLEREARRQKRPARVHLMVDTGMGRLGSSASSAGRLLERIRKSPGELHLEGICTHYSGSGQGDNRGRTRGQAARLLESLGLDPEAPRDFLLHASNSGAIFMPPDVGPPPLDLVRPGIAVYGINPGSLPAELDLRPVLALRSQIIFLKDIPAGTPVGYDSTHVTGRRTRIATVPVGYNDGYSWRLSNRAEVLIRGRRAPVVGSVTMDYLMVDVGHVAPVHIGDTVTLIGRDGDEEITALDLARQAGTIPYEVTCSLGLRVKRIYLG